MWGRNWLSAPLVPPPVLRLQLRLVPPHRPALQPRHPPERPQHPLPVRQGQQAAAGSTLGC